jgi:phytoene dehydrogenase-like protein
MPPGERGREYEAYVKKLGDEVVTTVEKYIPNLSRHLEFVKYVTPLSFESRVNLVRGGIYGPEQTPDQMGPGRFHDGTCGVEGLFLTGAGTKGGGVYFAMVSGIQAGRKTVSFLT